MKKVKLDNLLTVICLAVLILLMCTIFIRFFTKVLMRKGVNNAFTELVFFDKAPVAYALADTVDWRTLYPFSGEQQELSVNAKQPNESIIDKIKTLVFGVEDKIKEWTNLHLLGYQVFAEAANKYEALIGWNFAPYGEYNGIITLPDGYLAKPEQRCDVTEISRSLTDFKEYCIGNNIEFMFIMEPTKINKYEDPEIYGVTDFSNQNADELLDMLRAADVNVYDLRETAYSEKLYRKELFYRTDHHWRVESGLWASRHVLRVLNESYGLDVDASALDDDKFRRVDYPEWFLGSQGKKVTLARTTPDDFVMLYPTYDTRLRYEIPSLGIDTEGDFSITYEMSHVEKKDYYNRSPYSAYNRGTKALTKFDNELNNGGVKLLVIHDSFGNCVTQFMALGATEVDTLDIRHFTGSVQAYIKESQPDMVLVMYYPAELKDNVDWATHKDPFDFR